MITGGLEITAPRTATKSICDMRIVDATPSASETRISVVRVETL